MLAAVTMRLREAWRLREWLKWERERERERRECFTEIQIWDAKMKRKVSSRIAGGLVRCQKIKLLD